MQAPEQDIATPTYHPYNRLHQPRRLDYIFTAEIEEGAEGEVHQLRHLVSSDHDAVTVTIGVQSEEKVGCSSRPMTSHGAKQLKGEEEVQKLLHESQRWKGDSLRKLQRAAQSITEPKRNPFKYAESKDIK